MEIIVLMGFLFVAVVVGGAACGIIAVIIQGRASRELARLTRRVRALEDRLHAIERAPAAPQAAPTASATREPASTAAATPLAVSPAVQAPVHAVQPPRVPPPLPPWAEPVPPTDRREARATPSFEVLLGTKWMGWAGALLVVIGAGFFLKWVYDRGLIPPEGRLAIGALFGAAALAVGERFRRRDWLPAFQTMTGIGIAVFYLCIFFAFRIYALTGQTAAFGLATLVTALAIALAVYHNALPIAVLGVIGGLLSPIIFSEGGNHPYMLFGYLLIVDLVALGAAGFRRWRVLDLLCFFGTAALYTAWYAERFDPETQMLPALLFASLFYALFLAVPTVYSLARRIPERIDGLTLILLDATWSLIVFDLILYAAHRNALGFVVLGQAALVFGLFCVWRLRIRRDSLTAVSLLGIAMGLVTLAVPIFLELYAIPVAWAAEGIVLLWLGMRYREPIVRLGGIGALALAVGGLWVRLPLHTAAFVPVFNAPFGSWIAVAVAAQLAALVARTPRDDQASAPGSARSPLASADALLAPGAAVVGFALACVAVSMELGLYWELTSDAVEWRSMRAASLVLLWTAIPGVVAWASPRRPVPWGYVAVACYAVGGLVFLYGLPDYDFPSPVLALNVSFASRLLFVLALFGSLWAIRAGRLPSWYGVGVGVAGNVLLALLVALEFARWSDHTALITNRMGQALTSAAWAVHAFALIWVGLVMRKQALRWFGIILFSVTAAKVLIVDTAQIGHIYRIISLMATGLLLLAAMAAYHHYSARLLGPRDDEPPG